MIEAAEVCLHHLKLSKAVGMLEPTKANKLCLMATKRNRSRLQLAENTKNVKLEMRSRRNRARRRRRSKRGGRKTAKTMTLVNLVEPRASPTTICYVRNGPTQHGPAAAFESIEVMKRWQRCWGQYTAPRRRRVVELFLFFFVFGWPLFALSYYMGSSPDLLEPQGDATRWYSLAYEHNN